MAEIVDSLIGSVYLTGTQKNRLIEKAQLGFKVTQFSEQTWYFQPKPKPNYPEYSGFGPYTCAWITSGTTFELSHQLDGEDTRNLSGIQKEALKKSHEEILYVLKEATADR